MHDAAGVEVDWAWTQPLLARRCCCANASEAGLQLCKVQPRQTAHTLSISCTAASVPLQTCLPAPCPAPTQTIMVEGKNVVPDVWDVLDKIKGFTEKVRSGEWKGITGKPLTKVSAGAGAAACSAACV